MMLSSKHLKFKENVNIVKNYEEKMQKLIFVSSFLHKINIEMEKINKNELFKIVNKSVRVINNFTN